MMCTRTSRGGSALIVCLALIALLTVVVVAFFSQSQQNRRIEASGAARTKAEIFARSGLDYTVSRLIAEITDTDNSDEISDPVVSNGTVVYYPKTAENMLPVPQIKSAANGLRLTHVPSLLKQSITAFDPMASSINTATADKRGRSVGTNRWKAPMFYYSSPNFTTGQTPDWIYFSSEGATSTAPAIGRIAFNIYQTDGLLDLNVAGYPTSLTDVAVINSLKATVAGANLNKITSIMSFLDQTLVDMRNPGSVKRGDYAASFLADTSGFLESPQGDTQFAGRLDLIRYALTNDFNNNAMAFITAWSRSLDAPSTVPDDWNFASPDATTPNFFAPLVQRSADADIDSISLDTGETTTKQVKRGDPVAARRFPLNRIAWFEATAGTTRSLALQRYFGVTAATDGTWDYAYDHINTLREVDALGDPREPNFFEMLKAAIEDGSLGKTLSGGIASTSERDEDKDLQILQIGASIIDAATNDNTPTVIRINSTAGNSYACGIKDLPYLYGVRLRQIVHTDSEGKIEQIDQFALPVVVNPCRSASGSPARPEVRMRLVGNVARAGSATPPKAARNDGESIALESRYFASYESDDGALGTPDVTMNEPGVRIFTLDKDGFSTPSPAVYAGGGDAPSYFTQGAYYGFWLASTNGASAVFDGSWTAETEITGSATLESFNIVLEYYDGTNWVVYDSLVGDGRSNPADGLGASVGGTFASKTINGTPDNSSFTGAGTVYYLKPDPRTTRWGLAQGVTASNPTEIPYESGATYGGSSSLLVSTPAGNFSSVADPDGITRPNDLEIGSQTMADVLTNAESEHRNRILHRSFYVVGELGQVFRGQPWKTLDFTNSTSGDAALLDYFTINEGPWDGVVAGKVSLEMDDESSIQDVLSAQLSRTALQIGETDVLADDRIQSVIDGILEAPLRSPSGLVGRVASSEGENTKEKREAYIRALGTAGQTRTWNFFIDLIAQTGKLTPTTSTNLSDFVSQGESRLWMEVAIDRFTGKVVASHVEAYQE